MTERRVDDPAAAPPFRARVSFGPPERTPDHHGASVTAPGFLDPGGARVILGAAPDPLGLASPVAPGPKTLFGPRGAALLGPDGPLVVSDTGHHRLLGWNTPPTEDGAPADWLLGQPSFDREGRNAGGAAPGPETLNVPTGVAAYRGGLVVGDAWNNRVLLWRTMPRESGVPADLVLGQGDFLGGDPNRGTPEPGSDTMHWPFAVMAFGDTLVVGDAGNRRVLLWRTPPETNGAPADLVLGQPTMSTRSDNAGDAAGPGSLRWPHGLAVWAGDLVVSDAGNNRLLIWDGWPEASGAPAARVVGQPDFHSVDHNQGRYWPTAGTLNMPYDCDVLDGEHLVVADTASSRLLRFRRGETDANALAGQDRFDRKGDNGWKAPSRRSVCWPYGLRMDPGGRTLVVADSGNNRVLLWDLSDRAEEGTP